jgi:hypothetical protein
MFENIFFVLTLMLAAPRAPGVEVTFTDGPEGSGRVTRYRLPLPLDNQSTRLKFSESEPGGTHEISLRALMVKDKSGTSWLDYEIRRLAAGRQKDDVDVAGAVAMPSSGPVVVGELASAHGPVTVRVEVIHP